MSPRNWCTSFRFSSPSFGVKKQKGKMDFFKNTNIGIVWEAARGIFKIEVSLKRFFFWNFCLDQQFPFIFIEIEISAYVDCVRSLGYSCHTKKYAKSAVFTLVSSFYPFSIFDLDLIEKSVLQKFNESEETRSHHLPWCVFPISSRGISGQ